MGQVTKLATADLLESFSAVGCAVGPEPACLIDEFECSIQKSQSSDFCHHEQKKHLQVVCAQDVKSLKKVIQQMGNSFAESSDDLLVLDSRNIVDSAVADTVHRIETLGGDQYELYVTERLVNQ